MILWSFSKLADFREKIKKKRKPSSFINHAPFFVSLSIHLLLTYAHKTGKIRI